MATSEGEGILSSEEEDARRSTLIDKDARPRNYD